MFYNKSPAIGITKFVNYSNSSPQRAEKFSRYLQNLSKTNSAYVATNYLDRDNVEQSIKVIERKWKPGGSRSFKQGILAYGVPVGAYPVEEIMKFNKELLQKTFPDFPWMFTVHTNKNLLHSHFLLVTTNVLTGKKLSQSPKDLQSFKDCYDDLAVKYGLSVIKRNKTTQILHSNLPEISTEYSNQPQILESSYVEELPTITLEPTLYANQFNASQYKILSGIPTNSFNSNLQSMIESFLTPIALQIQHNVERWKTSKITKKGSINNEYTVKI